jgi:hypothetical protein
MRTARVSLYMAKPDEHGAIRSGIDVEADCRRNMQREGGIGRGPSGRQQSDFTPQT